MTQRRPRRGQVRRGRRFGAAIALGLVLGLAGAPASANEYDEQRSGHPLRIAAYTLYPIAFLIDRLILRPAHWLGTREPFDSVFGHKDRY